MKKLFSIMAVASALFVGYSTYNTQQNTELTDIALANVEALATGADFLPEVVVECSSDNYGKCCELLSMLSRFGTPVYYYCAKSENTKSNCTRFRESVANMNLQGF